MTKQVPAMVGQHHDQHWELLNLDESMTRSGSEHLDPAVDASGASNTPVLTPASTLEHTHNDGSSNLISATSKMPDIKLDAELPVASHSTTIKGPIHASANTNALLNFIGSVFISFLTSVHLIFMQWGIAYLVFNLILLDFNDLLREDIEQLLNGKIPEWPSIGFIALIIWALETVVALLVTVSMPQIAKWNWIDWCWNVAKFSATPFFIVNAAALVFVLYKLSSPMSFIAFETICNLVISPMFDFLQVNESVMSGTNTEILIDLALYSLRRFSQACLFASVINLVYANLIDFISFIKPRVLDASVMRSDVKQCNILMHNFISSLKSKFKQYDIQREKFVSSLQYYTRRFAEYIMALAVEAKQMFVYTLEAVHDAWIQGRTRRTLYLAKLGTSEVKASG